MKKCLAVVLIIGCMICVFVLPSHALSGVVSGPQWGDVPRHYLIRRGEASLNAVTHATLAWQVDHAQTILLLGFTVYIRGDVLPGTPIGASLFLGEELLGSWQNGYGAHYDRLNYSLRGAAWFCEMFYMFVLELGSTHFAAFEALQHLRVQLIDQEGSRSKIIDFPIAVEDEIEPTNTPLGSIATGARITTTTTRATTTDRSTVSLRPWTFGQQQVAQTTQLQTTAHYSPDFADGPPRFSIVTTWHTVIISDAAEDYVLSGGFGHNGLTWGTTVPLQEPQLTMPAAQPEAISTQPPSQNSALLTPVAIVLLLLAMMLLGYWAMLQRKTKVAAAYDLCDDDFEDDADDMPEPF